MQEGLVYGYMGFSCLALNRPKEGVEYCQRAITLVKGAGEYWELGVAYTFRFFNSVYFSRFKEGVKEWEEMRRVIEPLGLPQVLGWYLVQKVFLFYFSGEMDDKVIEKAEEGIRLLAQTRDKLVETNGWAHLGFVYYLSLIHI